MSDRAPDPVNGFVIVAVVIVLAFGIACLYGVI